MKPFPPITIGLFGPVAVNRRFFALEARISALEAKLGVEETPVNAAQPAKAPETAKNPDAPKQVAQDPQNSADSAIDAPFDWQACEDAEELKLWALEAHSLTFAQNVKKVATIKGQIAAFLTTPPEA